MAIGVLSFVSKSVTPVIWAPITALAPAKLSTVWLVLAALLLVAACAPPGPGVILRNQRFSVEVADDPGERTLGLMFREEMPADHGMLFIFEQEVPRAFWMKNTRIPLDILYFNRRLALVSLHRHVPPCRADPCPNYPSEKAAKYVLELNAGIAQRLKVAPGDSLILDL